MRLKMSSKWAGKIAEETADAKKDAIIGTVLGAGLAGGMAGAAAGSGKFDAKQLAGDVVGATGQELLEYGVKKAFSKQAAGVIAQQAGAGAVKQAAASTATKVVAGQIAKQTAATAVRTTITTATKTAASTAAKAALAMAGGPIGLALLLISLTLGFMDMFWNPWKNYFNKDLDEMIGQINDEATKQYKIFGYSYPTTMKPNITPETEDETKAYWQEVKEYLRDRNLILPQEAYEQLLRRIDDMNSYRSRRYEITAAHLQLLQSGITSFQEQEQESNWSQIKDITEASRLKNEMADKMAHYVFISVTQEDIKTNRTQLMLYTALLYKKGVILPPSQRSAWTDVKQYFEVYWFRFLFYTSLLVSIVFSSIFYSVFAK